MKHNGLHSSHLYIFTNNPRIHQIYPDGWVSPFFSEWLKRRFQQVPSTNRLENASLGPWNPISKYIFTATTNCHTAGRFCCALSLVPYRELRRAIQFLGDTTHAIVPLVKKTYLIPHTVYLRTMSWIKSAGKSALLLIRTRLAFTNQHWMRTIFTALWPLTLREGTLAARDWNRKVVPELPTARSSRWTITRQLLLIPIAKQK